MPVIFDKSPTPDCRLAIWQITESLKELEDFLDFIPEHESMLSNFKLDARKLEWICSRALIKKLIPEIKRVNIIYDMHGKPTLENSDYHISISHTRLFVTAIVSNKSAVAIDLETIQDRIENISKRFVNEDEKAAINPNSLIDHMHVLWGAKESLYKLYSKGDLDFLDDIYTDKFNYQGAGELKAYILKEDLVKSYAIHYQKIKNLMLVYVIDSD